jgi:hypothetical protein
MSTHNKIVIASNMFVEADARYRNASADIDYIVSILMSGAVVGIVGPLLKEQGGRTMHQLLAKIGDIVAEPGDGAHHEGMYRAVYNSLKHTGNERANLNPSNDLAIHTDLRVEAAHMLDAAKEDFRKIIVSADVRNALTQQFVTLLEAHEDYA